MKRGEVWEVDFGGSVGGEIKKKRPAVIISRNAINRNHNRVQVIPLTSNVKKLYPNEAYVMLNGNPGKALADQIQTAAKERLLRKFGTLLPREIRDIEKALRVQLDLG